ncbi:MAG: N-acyl homoserine lactonase family protein [Evtepia sp.]|uniref:N-acyl homoserine lactonase family protein n=1 Tax=Evtepia sp. TaxID=2773933 RepID=UPI002A7477D7|nr:N-acyl homoserine lactonase family protein [Evtepia sp.]MDY3014493.1 N-acyl homoserine lactonase family protein [Evtepia sp.]
MGLKFSVLYLGKMEFPKFRLVQCPDEENMVRSPAVAILIQHPELGNILYDTGNSPAFADVYTPEMLHNYPVTELISIKDALADKGLTPHDIDHIILSHLHFDHAGGLQDFVGTKAIERVIVSEEDLKNAYFSVMTGNGGAYIRSLFDVEGVQFRAISGDTKLAEDLELFVQPSHTPGVIGMILKTEHHGTVITTSDTIYTRESYEQELPPGGTINKTPEEFYDNLKRIKKMEQDYQATLLFGHDYDQIMEWVEKGWMD